MRAYFLFLLIFLFLPCSAIEISTNARLIDGVYYVLQGEIVEVKILGDPSQELAVSIVYKFTIPSSDGWYYYSQNKFPIPLSSSFEVKAYPVQNITVEAKFWIFSKKLEANATNDVAKVSANVPAGRFDVKIYGIARGNTVNIEAKANAKIKLDSSGVYSISYDTSKLPLGDMEVIADSEKLKVKVVSSLPTPTPTPPTPTPTPTPESTPTPEPTPTPTPTSTPTPTPSQAEKPALKLNRTAVCAKEEAEVMGENFTAKSEVVLAVLNKTLLICNTDDSGTFKCILNTSDLPFGKHLLKAKDSSGLTAEAEFEVLNCMIDTPASNASMTPETPEKTPNQANEGQKKIIPGFEIFIAIAALAAAFTLKRKP